MLQLTAGAAASDAAGAAASPGTPAGAFTPPPLPHPTRAPLQGLAALLVQGLSGCTPEEVVRLPADFIGMLGLQQALTPSRNNGFLNMFKLMQKKVGGLGWRWLALALALVGAGAGAGGTMAAPPREQQARSMHTLCACPRPERRPLLTAAAAPCPSPCAALPPAGSGPVHGFGRRQRR